MIVLCRALTGRGACAARATQDSVRRITEGWRAQVEAQRQAEAEQANAPAQRGETPLSERLSKSDPLAEQANISTDGAMLLVQAEGWKEVKTTVISAVSVKGAGERAVEAERPSRRVQDPWVPLSRHSYQAGLWDADTNAPDPSQAGGQRPRRG